MALVFNATNEIQSTKAFGNWFTLKPKQIKNFQDDIAAFLTQNRRSECGLVSLPEAFEDPEYKNSEEGQKALAEAEAAGIASYIDFHRAIIYNNQVSMRRDLEMANIKADPAVFASPGEIKAMELVASYQVAADDAAEQRAAKVKDLMKKVGSVEK